MKEHARLTHKQKVDIIEAYDEQLIPMIELAEQYGVSRQAIYKIIKKAGADTTKHKIVVSCTTCGNPIIRHKATIRKQLNHFCNNDCYYAFLQAGNGQPFIESRYGSIVARNVVSQHFTLQEQHRVHHKDRNQFNNRIDNLCVFANPGDHLRHHRGFDVNPIWDGASV